MMFWQQEPLATLFWGCLFVFLVTWGWAGDRHYSRGRAQEEAEWKAALKWATEVQTLPKPSHRTTEQWATMQLEVQRILRGDSNKSMRYSALEY